MAKPAGVLVNTEFGVYFVYFNLINYEHKVHIKIRIPEIFHHITVFVLPYLALQLIEGDSNLALDVINDISKHFGTILPHLRIR